MNAPAGEQKKAELENGVMEAVNLAEHNKAFEVVYYPYMRVKMKTDKSSRIYKFFIVIIFSFVGHKLVQNDSVIYLKFLHFTYL